MRKNIFVFVFTLLISQTAMSNDCPKVLNTKLNNLTGESVDFCNYRGKVILAVTQPATVEILLSMKH